MKKSYWFILEPFVHISVKQGNVLLFNTLNGKSIHYENKYENKYENNSHVLKLIKLLTAKKSLWVTRLSEKQLENPEISKFIKRVKTSYMGDLIDTAFSRGKPVQLPPILNLDRDVEKFKAKFSGTIGEEIMKYLDEVSLYINGQCRLDCKMCTGAHRQFFCCTKSTGGHSLPLKHITRLLKSAKGSFLSKINILGGDIFLYPELADLLVLLNSLPAAKAYYVHYLNTLDRENLIQSMEPGASQLNIIVDFPVDRQALDRLYFRLREMTIDYYFCFVLRTDHEIESAQEIISALKIPNVSMHPYYDGRNLTFFKRNVFITKRDISLAKPGLKEIFSRQKMNTLNFGKLTVMSNGHIHTNVNTPKLGKLGGSSLYEAVYKEMKYGKNWRRTRDKCRPCNSCVYSLLCPPVSNYEQVIGRNNLCHIKKSE